LLALIVSTILGLAITSGTWNAAMSKTEKVIAVVVAGLNIILLTGSALGIVAAVSGNPVTALP
jgi:hypothetical protein